MGLFVDITGMKFNKLTAIKKTEKRSDHKVVWEFLCDCGNTCFSVGSRVKSGYVKSCGCLVVLHQRSRVGTGLTKIDGKHVHLYKKWQSMKTRCYRDKKCKYNEVHYKQKGIKVCDEWLVFKNFRDWAYSNGFIDGKLMILDRIDNNKGYSPENCRFVDPLESTQNRTNTVRINGKTIKQIADEHSMTYSKLYNRVFNLGMSLEKALINKDYRSKKIS